MSRDHVEAMDWTTLEADLLAAGRSAGPTDQEEARVWARLAAATVTTGAAMTTGTALKVATPAKVGALAAGAKTLIPWVVVAALAGGGALILRHPLAERSPPASSGQPSATSGGVDPAPAVLAPPAALAPPEPPTVAVDDLPRVRVAPVPSPAVGVVISVAPPNRESSLAEESRLVDEARRALGRGEGEEALRLLREGEGTFGWASMLHEEREALTVLALARTHGGAQASARGRAFLEAYPASLYRARVAKVVEASEP